MRRRLVILALLSGVGIGCRSQPAPPASLGIVSDSTYGAARRDDQIRLLGEDKAPAERYDVPYYRLPGAALDAVIDVTISAPAHWIYAHLTEDDASHAARQMFDPASADNRRYGILRLADESYARKGADDRRLWAHIGDVDKDYSVRAAAIRALNRSRAPGNTDLFLTGLKDQEPLVRLEAAKALANLPDASATTPLLDHLQTDVSQDVRIACADALRAYHNDEVARHLVDVLNDRDFAVAWQARQSLVLMTRHDFAYDSKKWTGYLAGASSHFV